MSTGRDIPQSIGAGNGYTSSGPLRAPVHIKHTDCNNIGSRRILVVDDNEAIHEDFRKILNLGEEVSPSLAEARAALFGEVAPTARKCDYQIDSAFQGQQALQMVEQALARREPYALAFVD